MNEPTKRGPYRTKKERMRAVSIRLPQKVVDYFNGSTSEMRKVLLNHIAQ